MDTHLLPPEWLEPSPLEQGETLPSLWYTDANFHQWECRALFSNQWQWIGHQNQLTRAGDYLTARVAGESVLAVRGEDGLIRTFFNVCPHRGGPLALEDGHSKALQCRYHGWTFHLDGKLKKAREMGAIQGFEPCRYGLKSLTSAPWQGFIFASVETPAVPLAALTRGMEERLESIELSRLHHHCRTSYSLNCNWKVYVDNFLEGYHIPMVHPSLNRLLDTKSYRTALAEHHVLQYSPVRSGGAYAEGEVCYFFVFPNLMLNVMPGRCQVNRVLPKGVARTEVIFDYFYEDVVSSGAKQEIERDLAYSDLVQREDMLICERVQEGLNSRAYDRGRYSQRHESGVHHFHEYLKRTYRRFAQSEGQLPGFSK